MIIIIIIIIKCFSHRAADTEHLRPDISAVLSGDPADQIRRTQPDGRADHHSWTNSTNTHFYRLQLHEQLSLIKALNKHFLRIACVLSHLLNISRDIQYLIQLWTVLENWLIMPGKMLTNLAENRIYGQYGFSLYSLCINNIC